MWWVGGGGVQGCSNGCKAHPPASCGAADAADAAGSNVRFVLMNSFSTSADTKQYLEKNHKGEVGDGGVRRGGK